jgi:hypothetical protein
MHRENASRPFCVGVVVATVAVEATFATRGEPPLPQPAASSEDAETATTDPTISGRRQRTISSSFHSTASKAHHRNLNVRALKLRRC